VDDERKLAGGEIEALNITFQQRQGGVAGQLGALRPEAVGISRQDGSGDSKIKTVARPEQAFDQPLSDETSSTRDEQAGSGQGLPGIADVFERVVEIRSGKSGHVEPSTRF
jgi:hypothetical protein